MDTDRSRLDDFIIIKTLGKGATATVKLGKNPSTNEAVALKIIRPEKSYVLSTELRMS